MVTKIGEMRRKVGEVGMRLIDADALIALIPDASADVFENCRNCTCLDSEQIVELINKTPTVTLALLKEQEAVEPILIREGRNKNYNDYVCPCCDNEVVYEQNYCSECGIPFMWKGR